MRDVGKTYGLRKQLIADYLKDGARFVQLVRYKTELPIMSGEYLAKVGREFPGHMFKTDNRFAWCAERVPDGGKPDWRCMGYFCALTQMQQIKSTTFVDPYRIVLDEAIIDPALQRYTSYLPREYYVLTQAIDSITREQVDEDGNAVPREPSAARVPARQRPLDGQPLFSLAGHSQAAAVRQALVYGFRRP